MASYNEYDIVQLKSPEDGVTAVMPCVTPKTVLFSDGTNLETNLPLKQNSTDENLETEDKTITGAINELNNCLTNLSLYAYENLGSIAEGFEYYRKNFDITSTGVDTEIAIFSEENFGKNFELDFECTNISSAYGVKMAASGTNFWFQQYGRLSFDGKSGGKELLYWNVQPEETIRATVTRNNDLVIVKLYRNGNLVADWNGNATKFIQEDSHLIIGGGSGTTSSMVWPMHVNYAKFRFFE